VHVELGVDGRWKPDAEIMLHSGRHGRTTAPCLFLSRKTLKKSANNFSTICNFSLSGSVLPVVRDKACYTSETPLSSLLVSFSKPCKSSMWECFSQVDLYNAEMMRGICFVKRT